MVAPVQSYANQLRFNAEFVWTIVYICMYIWSVTQLLPYKDTSGWLCT